MDDNAPHRASLPAQVLRSKGFWAVALVFPVVAIVIFLRIGSWLVREDPPEKADAIIVLSGGLPARAEEAARLYAQGFAPNVWLTRPTEPQASMDALGVPYEGEEAYSRAVLEHGGVPAAAIFVLSPPIRNTADEIRAIDSRMATTRGSTIIIVTSKAHTRRVRVLWTRLTDNRNRLLIRAATDDDFDPAHWWRTTHGVLDVLREVLGLLNAWLGLRIHPV